VRARPVPAGSAAPGLQVFRTTAVASSSELARQLGAEPRHRATPVKSAAQPTPFSYPFNSSQSAVLPSSWSVSPRSRSARGGAGAPRSPSHPPRALRAAYAAPKLVPSRASPLRFFERISATSAGPRAPRTKIVVVHPAPSFGAHPLNRLLASFAPARCAPSQPPCDRSPRGPRRAAFKDPHRAPRGRPHVMACVTRRTSSNLPWSRLEQAALHRLFRHGPPDYFFQHRRRPASLQPASSGPTIANDLLDLGLRVYAARPPGALALAPGPPWSTC